MNVLQIVKLELQALDGISVSERGTGDARFLYVRSAKRAVEVSTQDAGLVVKFWNTVDELRGPPISQEIVTSMPQAIGEITGWLLR